MKPSPSSSPRSPTTEAYRPLQDAYDFFNDKLFDNALPLCVLTLQKKNKRVLGFVNYTGFERVKSGARSYGLAMNPSFTLSRDPLDVLSTVAHEMTHIRQIVIGKPGRRGYHNKEWAAMMKEIGLYPSNTGKPGGKETGEKITHYVVDGGPFHQYAKELIASGFAFLWGEAKPLETEEDGDPDGTGVAKKKKDNSSNRVRFLCPQCHSKAWAKSTMKLMCGNCTKHMHPS